MAESKVMLDNLPEGTMISDIEKALKEWISTVKIININLIPHKGKKKTKFAFVQLSTAEECLGILKYFDDHFTLEQGFPIEDGFGNFSLGVVKKFVPKSSNNNESTFQNNIKKPLNNTGTFQNKTNVFQNMTNTDKTNDDDDTVSWLSGVDDLHCSTVPEKQQQHSSQPAKIMLEEVPADTTKSEIENLIKTKVWSEAIIMNIDLAHPKNRKDKLNAYITLGDQNQCDSFINHFQTNFTKGFWFVNNLGCDSKMTAKHYTGKKRLQSVQKGTSKKEHTMLEYHLILKKTPPETTSDEICGIIKEWLSDDNSVVDTLQREKYWFVKLKSWADCDTVLQYYNEKFEPHGGYAFQNKNGKYNLVLFLRNEHYFLSTGGKKQASVNTQASVKTHESANVHESANAHPSTNAHKKEIINSNDIQSFSQTRGKERLFKL